MKNFLSALVLEMDTTKTALKAAGEELWEESQKRKIQ
jgi:hypothetical protein